MGLCTPGAELKALWLPLQEPWAEGESGGWAFPTPQRASAGGLSWTKGGERLVESW